MSRFLKNFFGEKSKSENLGSRNGNISNANTPTKEKSSLQVNNFVVDDGSLT